METAGHSALENIIPAIDCKQLEYTLIPGEQKGSRIRLTGLAGGLLLRSSLQLNDEALENRSKRLGDSKGLGAYGQESPS